MSSQLIPPLPSYVLNISDTGLYRISDDDIIKNKIRLALLLNAMKGEGKRRIHHNYPYKHVKINENIYNLDNTSHVNDLIRYIEHHNGSHPSFFAKIKDVPALDAYRRFLEHETARAYHVPDGFQERTRRPDIVRASPVSESEIIPQSPIVIPQSPTVIPEQSQLVIPGADHMTPQQIQAVLRGIYRNARRWGDSSEDDEEDLYAGKRKLKKSKRSKSKRSKKSKKSKKSKRLKSKRSKKFKKSRRKKK